MRGRRDVFLSSVFIYPVRFIGTIAMYRQGTSVSRISRRYNQTDIPYTHMLAETGFNGSDSLIINE